MHFIQQPLQELQGVVLLGALVLGPVPLHHLLERGTQFGAVLARPKGLQHQRQLFRDLPFGAVLLGVQFVPPDQIVFVPIVVMSNVKFDLFYLFFIMYCKYWITSCGISTIL